VGFQGNGRFRKLAPDYSQLGLFTSVPAEAVIAALPGEATISGVLELPPIETEPTDGRHEPIGQPDSETLDDPPAGGDRGTGKDEPVAARPPPGSGTDGRPSPQSDRDSKDGLPGGLGTGDTGMGVPSGRGPPEPAPPETAIVRQPDPEPNLFPSRDFRITDALRIGEGSLRDKALDNIEAIRALKRIDAESRAPTDAEKSLLVKYTGWGAIANAFRPYPPPEWQHTATELRELLTPPEYDSARASTPNAHYTSPDVIKSIWQAMQRFGLRPGAQILEPSMGIGHFFGLMPDELLTGTRRTGVELDSVTARIAKCLYPDSTVFAKGFEDTPLPDNFFDAVIGNIPFGNYAVHDPAYRRTPVLTRTIHDYFLAKSLDKTRPGGVLALITSRYTMDKQDSAIRNHLAERADLIAAIRLPNTSFKANAGTEVTTDILFLQKRAPGAPANAESWQDLAGSETPDGPVSINEYFVRHPEMMLGHMRLERGLYSAREPTLAGEFVPERLATAIASLPAGIYPRSADLPPTRDITQAESVAIETVKDGAFAERDGVIVVRSGAGFEALNLSESVTARVRGMLAVRDAVRLVLSTVAFDATNFDQLKKFFDQLPTPIDHVLVTGPGPYYAPLAELDIEKARQDVEAHLLMPLQVARYAAKKVRPGGTLLFMSGIGGRRTAPGLALVSALTAALPALTKDLALELAPVRVNLIAAGFVDTPLSASLLGDQLEARREQLRATLPIRRVVGPADVAALAVHLMTNTALTGGTYDIDGGQQLVDG